MTIYDKFKNFLKKTWLYYPLKKINSLLRPVRYIVKSIKNDAIIVDLGKNNLTQDAIQHALDQNIEIYRTNITSAFEGFIYEAIKTDEI